MFFCFFCFINSCFSLLLSPNHIKMSIFLSLSDGIFGRRNISLRNRSKTKGGGRPLIICSRVFLARRRTRLHFRLSACVLVLLTLKHTHARTQMCAQPCIKRKRTSVYFVRTFLGACFCTRAPLGCTYIQKFL